MKMLYLHLRKV